MKKHMVSLCLILFAIRVFFIPLFFPFDTNGFWAQASVAGICLFISAAMMSTGGHGKWVKGLILIVAASDFIFFLLVKNDYSRNFPFYPRYILMSIPLVIAFLVSNIKHR